VSDLSHLAEGYRERAMWADKERIAWIRMDRWLGFPKAEVVRKTLDGMLRYPPRTRMPCLLIYGQTGMGKSRIVERFEAENPRGFNEATGTATIPVVAVQLPPQPTDGEFYGEVLEKLGAGLSCPLLSGPSTMTVWIEEGTTNASEEAQARGDHRQAA
jgi:hypothetical protein